MEIDEIMQVGDEAKITVRYIYVRCLTLHGSCRRAHHVQTSPAELIISAMLGGDAQAQWQCCTVG